MTEGQRSYEIQWIRHRSVYVVRLFNCPEHVDEWLRFKGGSLHQFKSDTEARLFMQENHHDILERS